MRIRAFFATCCFSTLCCMWIQTCGPWRVLWTASLPSHYDKFTPRALPKPMAAVALSVDCSKIMHVSRKEVRIRNGSYQIAEV